MNPEVEKYLRRSKLWKRRCRHTQNK